jgi:hypothetical protein
VQPLVRPIPRVGFIHDQNSFVGSLIMTDEFNHPNGRALLIGGGLVFQFGKSRWTLDAQRCTFKEFMKAPIAVCCALLASIAVPSVRAQFSPALLQNDSYWGDGKAEVDFYDAQVMRDGQLRHCELQIILAKATASMPREAQDPSAAPPETVPVIRVPCSRPTP